MISIDKKFIPQYITPMTKIVNLDDISCYDETSTQDSLPDFDLKLGIYY